MISLQEAQTYSQLQINALPYEERVRLAEEVQRVRDALRKEKQLLFYQPVSEDARRFHLSLTPQRIILGGNGSSKSESQLVDMLIEMTGILPFSLEADYPREKLRPPIHARLIVQSLTNTWEQSIKPKLLWYQWTGLADGKHGHWGWIPKDMLINGRWDHSWSAQYRTLTLTNGSTMQVMSHDQEAEDHASASLHRIGVDEGPFKVIWRENLMRMREGGFISLAMTPPDDESKAWQSAWVYDELYEKGMPGPNKDPSIESFTFFTENNRNISQDFLAKLASGLTPAQKETRFHGRFIHLGGRVYATYTSNPQWWCFNCNDISFITNFDGDRGQCTGCGGTDTTRFAHLVEPFDEAYGWPCIFTIDPHPRKPHSLTWDVVSPYDDIFRVAEIGMDGTPEETKKKVDEIEQCFTLNIVKRLMDPNMGMSPSGTTNKRGRTVRMEFDDVGLRCDMADDNQDTARTRVKELLKPDPRTKEPRFHVFTSCAPLPGEKWTGTDYNMRHWSWGEWASRSAAQRDQKAVPQEKYSDFIANLHYVVNSNPTFAGLSLGARPSRRKGRKGPY